MLFQASTELIRNAPQTEDYSEILLQISRSLDNYSQQYIREFIRRNVSADRVPIIPPCQYTNDVYSIPQRDDITKYETELSEKEKQLAESTQKIADLDSKIQELEQQNKELLQQRTEQELLQIQEKKRA